MDIFNAHKFVATHRNDKPSGTFTTDNRLSDSCRIILLTTTNNHGLETYRNVQFSMSRARRRGNHCLPFSIHNVEQTETRIRISSGVWGGRVTQVSVIFIFISHTPPCSKAKAKNLH